MSLTVRLPCKIGDEVWCLCRKYGNYTVKKGRVSEMLFVGPDMQLCIVVYRVCRGIWGETIFATAQEAWRAKEGKT